MTLEQAGIREGSLVLLKPWAERQTVASRLFRLGSWLSPGARTAEVGQWPGFHVAGCYALDGVFHSISTAEIARRLGIKATTAQSRAHRLQQRGLIAPRPRGGAYPSQRALARQEDAPIPVQSPVQTPPQAPVQSGAETGAVQGHMHGAEPVQRHGAEPPIPPAITDEFHQLWQAIHGLRQDLAEALNQTVQQAVQEALHGAVQSPVQRHGAVPSLPEPMFPDHPEANKSERWNLYLKKGLRWWVEDQAKQRGMSPSQLVQEILWQALSDRRDSTS